MLGKDSEAAQDSGVGPDSVAEPNSEVVPNSEVEQDFEVACDYGTALNSETGSYSGVVQGPVVGGVYGEGDHPEDAEHGAVCEAWQHEAEQQECVAV